MATYCGAVRSVATDSRPTRSILAGVCASAVNLLTVWGVAPLMVVVFSALAGIALAIVG
jgi:hypothetical protein